jgi:hypothetical protein
VASRAPDWARTYWADRLGESDVAVALAVEAGPPFLGPLIGLGTAALFLLTLGPLFDTNSPPFQAVWIALLVGSLVAGDYAVRRSLAARWRAAIGLPPPSGMLLGVVADRLVIWRWPRRGRPPLPRLVDAPLKQIRLRPRIALVGGLEIELPNGKTLFVNHSVGPGEREALALILAAAAEAIDPANGAARPDD